MKIETTILIFMLLFTCCAKSEKPILISELDLGSSAEAVSNIYDDNFFVVADGNLVQMERNNQKPIIISKVKIPKAKDEEIHCAVTLKNICFIAGGKRHIQKNGFLLSYDVKDKNFTRFESENLSSILCITVCESKGILVSGTAKGNIVVWNYGEKKIIKQFGNFQSEIQSISIDKSGSQIFTGEHGKLTAWDARNFNELKNIPIEGTSYRIRLFSDETKLVIAGSLGNLETFALNNLKAEGKNNISKNGAILNFEPISENAKYLCALNDGFVALVIPDSIISAKIGTTDLLLAYPLKNGKGFSAVDKDANVKTFTWDLMKM